MPTLELTTKQLANLQYVLDNTTDDGPLRAGWASTELEELRIIVDRAVEEDQD